MAPPPHSPFSAAILILHFLLPAAAACSLKAVPAVCPPFSSSPPPYPFSASPGCGHPSFQINCSTPHSTISINHLSFSLLHFDPNSSSLLLSPSHSFSHSNCSSSSRFSSIPSRSISLSGSPFRPSDALCSRLNNLRPCGSPNSLNGSCCPWECKLIHSPALLLQECGPTPSPATYQGCQGDVLDFLKKLLEMGIEVEWDSSDGAYFGSCRACQSSKGVCGYNSSDPKKQFLCFNFQSRVSPPWMHRQDPSHIAMLGLIFVITCLLLLVSVVVMIFRSRRFNSSRPDEDPTSIFLRRHRSLSLLPPVFTYEELELSTGHFDQSRKIGDGGFGSVYLGRLPDGRAVAVKHLHRQRPTAAAAAARAFSAKSFCNEILILSSIDHPNLVKLHGYCSDPRGLLLVYDYVPNGTLADHLHGRLRHRRQLLTWQVRLDMAVQIGLAIEYLHFSVSPPIAHRDITSSNIFVEGDMRIKVGDFGLSRLLEIPDEMNSSSSCGSVWTGPQGTPGYLDPDYHHSFLLTEKSDVYSFGVVLLELVSGLRAVDQSRDKREFALADFAVSKIQMGMLHQMVDPMIALDGALSEGVHAMAELAFRCVAAEKDDRPDSREVAEELKRIRNKSR
ncbi:LEAF RUST 10 DISEASE-RESISTANCE LOCUS RECEPTOR-LIKE PROTEIN KINASE-like 1.5 [Punica granatum]|uniref:LEAF RUST 10 DISEASE-RESISTANCE LOCUS RECEPTOR-LIKE PROTEIN KINASE-like 1.5 n=3 Tax=Punica granatum TaxID=22663 RepID=A0A6P8CXK9_PUNGR|nr:LEAF RUST 10 DISEASE-RESISTANCE LOCUS RECEPTOR-LIKE PROTEIN KINASE-like 1.5 [Punica granatum]